MLAYRGLSDGELFKVERVALKLRDTEMPGRPRSRVICNTCGEGVNDGREVFDGLGRRVCRACAFGSYYEVLRD